MGNKFNKHIIFNYNIRDVVNMSRLEQSHYADDVCIATVNNIKFNKEQLEDIIIDGEVCTKDFESWNVNSIGNLAYTSLYCKNKQIRELYEKVLLKYIDWIKSKN